MIDRAEELLKRHEGFRRFPYRDTEGLLTVGYGRNLVHRGISKDEALYLLKNDIQGALEDLRRAFPWTVGLDDVRQVVLIDMAVNLGINRLRGFQRMMSALREARWNEAAAEMLNSMWARQVGQRAVELSEMMRTGSYPSFLHDPVEITP